MEYLMDNNELKITYRIVDLNKQIIKNKNKIQVI